MTDIALERVRERLGEAVASEGPGSLIDALGAIRDHLHANDFTYAETRPLLDLMGALLDHGRGKPHPLLAVRGNAGNAANFADGEFKAATAATMTLIQRCPGETKSKASAKIAKRFKEVGIDVGASKVDGWHREITSERVAGDLIASYKFYIERFGEPDEIKAQAALESLVTLARTKL